MMLQHIRKLMEVSPLILSYCSLDSEFVVQHVRQPMEVSSPILSYCSLNREFVVQHGGKLTDPVRGSIYKTTHGGRLSYPVILPTG